MSSNENITHVLKVVHNNQLAPEIFQLLLKAEHPIQYTSGDYIMLGFNIEELKPFSIADAPREDGLIECHIRNTAKNDAIEKLCSVNSGDVLVMQGPKKQMQLHPAHEAIIFVAGGTGFAPMRALLNEALRQQVSVPISFYWGAKSTEELYMHEWMIDISQKHGNIDYIPVISGSAEEWQGRTGLVHKAVLADHPSLDKARVYMCGPWPMIQAAKADFLAAGLVETKLSH